MGFASYIKSLYNGDYPDIGQPHFVVDHDYRTDVQGWSRADGTGPLDLWTQRNNGYVFRTGTSDYGTDAATVQAAIDAAVDFRGDMLVLTPGSYSIATALAVNVPGLRILGPPVRNPRSSRVTVTGTVTNTFDLANVTDDVEMAFIRHVPLTAGNSVRINGSDNLYVHHCLWDSIGVAADTATQGFVFVTNESLNPRFEDCHFLVDAAQGNALDITLTQDFFGHKLRFTSRAGTWATCVTCAASTDAALFDLCHVDGEGAVTNVFTGAAGGDELTVTRLYLNGTTGTSIETGFDATVAIDIAECYLTGDATTQGGTLITLA